jgi:hypothetical protein
MIETDRPRYQFYLAAVIALLLLMSLVNGYVAAAIAACLFVVGLALFPRARPTAIVSGLVAAAVAIVIVVLRMLV